MAGSKNAQDSPWRVLFMSSEKTKGDSELF